MRKTEKKTVGIIFGGASSEYEVSLRSAASVLRNIPSDRYDVVTIGISKEGCWFYYYGSIDDIERDEWESSSLPGFIVPDRGIGGMYIPCDEYGEPRIIKLDAVFPVLHGKNGEDGTVQGLLELAGIPFVGPGVLGSAVCMDKSLANTLFINAGIPHAAFETVRLSDMNDLDSLCDKLKNSLGYPMFVKPANAGSSVGVGKAKNEAELISCLNDALQYDSKLVVEKAIVGQEVEIAVLGNDSPITSAVGEIIPSHDFYDSGKYLDDSTELIVPARLSERTVEEIKRLAVKAYLLCGCRGLSRVDFFADGDGNAILNEINTIPGFTSISMYPRLFEYSGIAYPKLIDTLISLALEGGNT